MAGPSNRIKYRPFFSRSRTFFSFFFYSHSGGRGENLVGLSGEREEVSEGPEARELQPLSSPALPWATALLELGRLPTYRCCGRHSPKLRHLVARGEMRRYLFPVLRHRDAYVLFGCNL